LLTGGGKSIQNGKGIGSTKSRKSKQEGALYKTIRVGEGDTQSKKNPPPKRREERKAGKLCGWEVSGSVNQE